MENLALVSSPKMLLGSSSSPNLGCPISLKHSSFSLFHNRRNGSYQTRCKITARAHHRFSDKIRLPVRKSEKSENGTDVFASISSSTSKETSSSVGVTPQLVPPPPSSQIGSPLFWIGVGVGFSALFSWASSNLKKYAMQQAMKTLTGQMSSGTGSSPFSNSAFSQGSQFPFPFPMPPPPTSGTSTTPVASPPSRPRVTVDVSATDVEAAPHSSPVEVKQETEIKKEQQKYAFEDVSPQEVMQEDLFTSSKESSEQTPTKNAQFSEEVSLNGAAPKQDESYYKEAPKSSGKSPMSVEALEKMMEDPTVQKMVYPYLPEQMRNPETFKWMLQNPEYRQQLGDMLNNMGGGTEWDNRMMDSLKNFDLSSPEVKEQFDQIGLTPEDVIAKIMANPDVAMAFQNPRVQQAIMDCSQNPLSIAKYQNDKEVMDVFNKISELFPGVGSP
ncbi:hypothetical protein MKX03_006794 [Papaver bracteatum]|nr:hypothetical protein MKX03_006794 [Papaver bracteatum]